MATLLVMRLEDMHRVHPEQDNSRVCGRCGAPVGIYPSGQRMLRLYAETNRTLIIECNRCVEGRLRPGDAVPVVPIPGALEEPFESGPR